MSLDRSPPTDRRAWRQGSVRLATGGILAAVTLAGVVVLLAGIRRDPGQAAIAYLVAWVWCISIAAGALGLSIVIDCCGAVWHLVMRRGLEQVQALLPVLAVLFIPIAIALPRLYAWADPAKRGDPAVVTQLHAHARWLSRTSFCWRSATYLVVLCVLQAVRAHLARGGSATLRAQQRWAAIAAPLYALTISAAAFEWIMGVAPDYGSTIYGLLWWSVSSLGAAAIWSLLTVLMMSGGATATAAPAAVAPASVVVPPAHVTTQHLIALGRLQLTFLSFSMYLLFCQLLITYMGDLPSEVRWFLPRMAEPWGRWAVVAGVLGYVVPWCLMLSRGLKTVPVALALISAGVLVGRWMEDAWLLAPSIDPHYRPWSLDAVAAAAAIGGACACWLWWRGGDAARTGAVADDRWRASQRYESRIA